MASETLVFLLKVNVAAAAAILAVLALRAPMRRWFGARLAYALWLIVPVAAFAVMPPARIQFVTVNATSASASTTAAPTLGQLVDSPALMGVPADPTLLLLALWLGGAALALALLVRRQCAFIASLGRLEPDAGSDTHRTGIAGFGPAIVGAIAPKLIIPRDFEARFSEAEREIVLAHERVHLRNSDPMVNALVVLMRCINWFNPFVHLAAHVVRIDQELACDAAVMARYPRSRRCYGEAMLKTQIAPLSLPLGCYWPAHPAAALKQRIAMLKRDLPGKQRFSIGAAIAIALGLAAATTAWAAQPPLVIPVIAGVAPAAAPGAASPQLDARLIRAAKKGDAGLVRSLIAEGADVDARASDGATSLIIAARQEHLPLARVLLDNGADLELATARDGSALVAAARRGHGYIVDELVKRGADVNANIPGVETALIATVHTDDLALMKYLVEHGADVNLASQRREPWSRFNPKPRSPLEVAVSGDHVMAASYLRSKGARM